MIKNKLSGLYLISDESLIDQSKYFDFLDDALSAKPSIFQLRIKGSPKEEILYKAKELRKITNKYDVIFIINDMADIVNQVDADGLHIGKDDQNFDECRKIIGENKILGVSCYGDNERANKFINKNADYIAIGTPYFTKTKPDRLPTSFDTMKKITSPKMTVPIFAIGGIETSNVDQVMSTGVSGVAVINGVFSYNNPREKVASGSGVIISENGYIITNMHVINDAKEIEVVLNDKRTYTAEILGTDPNSDLALLKIDASKLKYLEFANSNELKIGQWVLAVGNPFNLSSTVTAGIVSAKSREINILNDGGIEAFIQTDAAINPGNSGGALVNTDGDLVGINTAIHSNTGSYTGYGFAIPSNMVKKIIEDLKDFGEVKRAYIGIHILDLNAGVAKELDLDDANGVFIAKVLKNSAAEKAGIKSYDVITKINDRKINTVSQLNEIIIQFDPGDQINCTVLRDNKEIEFNISLQN